MATNVGQRNVPDNAQTQQCYAVDACLNLSVHTLKICKNHNIFIDDYVEIRDSIIKLASDIFIDAYTANRIRVHNQDDWAERERLQKSAIDKINSLIGYINIAKRIYHLKRGKTEYWVKKAMDARTLLASWHQADVKRYKGT